MKIKELRIKHYKSIKDIQLKSKRVNVFIGEPNSGKSNILEALTFFSNNVITNENFKSIFRFKSVRDLFFDFDLSKEIEILTDQITCQLKKSDREKSPYDFALDYFDKKGSRYDIFRMNDSGSVQGTASEFRPFFKAYYYKRLNEFQKSFRNYLNPPYGDNLPALVISYPKFKKIVSMLLRDKGFKIQLNTEENIIMISKEIEEVIYSYPYISLSETLQRIIFMMIAIESNKDSILIFDEPESNTFPFYTKYIAERIALDTNNQYFITTHNPYLLFNIVEKMPQKDLNVIVTKMESFQTKLYTLNKKQLEEAIDMGYDVFFNLDKITG